MTDEQEGKFPFGCFFVMLVFPCLVLLCLGFSFFGPPGPSDACMVDGHTLRYTTAVMYNDFFVTDYGHVSVGEFGQFYEKFESAEPLDDGRWKAVFVNTKTGATNVQTLSTCVD